MSSSKSDSGDEDPAEPVDAEFEPAPDGEPASDAASDPEKSKSGGAGWFKVSLFVIAAAAIGGGSGWVAGQIWPAAMVGQDAAPGDLAQRVAALETADPGVTRSDLDGLQARIAALEEAQNASGLRADAVEQLVRDVADLRDRVETLETAPAPEAGADGNGASAGGAEAGASQAALADLDRRLTDALETVEARLQSVEDLAETARTTAEEARSAARQARDAAAVGAEARGEAGPSAAVEESLADLRATLAGLDERQSDLRAQLDALSGLADRIDRLERSRARSAAVSEIGERVTGLEAAVSRLDSSLEQAAREADGAAQAERSLAERALAFAALSEAGATSEPFVAEYADLARVWPQAPRRAALEPIARIGAPTLERLTARFPADAVRAASGEAETYFGVLRVRRDAAEGPAAAIEAALDDGDLAAAIDIADGLEGEAAAALADWRAQAHRRLSLETTLQAMAQALRRDPEGAE